jgi:tRNA uridine 5-carboxymethylaminomethyl modification enzyme
VDEPYRLFTSRSEFRLTVRQDNALARLAPTVMALGAYADGERAIVERRFAQDAEALRVAESTSITPAAAAPVLQAAGSAQLPHAMRVAEIAKRQGVGLAVLLDAAGVRGDLPADVLTTAELELKYAGYFQRERDQAEKMKRMGGFALASTLPYAEMSSLSFEARQKLSALQPSTLAQASRIPGVSPTDLQNLVLEVGRRAVR